MVRDGKTQCPLHSFRLASECGCWMFYTVPTSRVIFTAKTSMDLVCSGIKQVWTYSVLGEYIKDEKGDRVRTAGDQNWKSIVAVH